MQYLFRKHSTASVCRTAEHGRLEDDAWRQWGPYLSERQWGTVREDHSHDGNWFVHIQSDSQSIHFYHGSTAYAVVMCLRHVRLSYCPSQATASVVSEWLNVDHATNAM